MDQKGSRPLAPCISSLRTPKRPPRQERGMVWSCAYDRCRYEGCNNVRCSRSLVRGMCMRHGKQLSGVGRRVTNEFPLQFARVKRVCALFRRHIDKLMARQDGLCADPLGRCPCGQRPVPRDMMEVDHVVPICEGGTNCISNLHAVCACCHRAKTSAEKALRYQC